MRTLQIHPYLGGEQCRAEWGPSDDARGLNLGKTDARWASATLLDVCPGLHARADGRRAARSGQARSQDEAVRTRTAARRPGRGDAGRADEAQTAASSSSRSRPSRGKFWNSSYESRAAARNTERIRLNSWTLSIPVTFAEVFSA